MKGYIFIRGIDADVDNVPVYELGMYLDFDKAFNKLVELNHKKITNDMAHGCKFYDYGYGYCYYPEDDFEAKKASADEDWELLDAIIEKHIITDEIEINKRLCVNGETYTYGMYAIKEIEIIDVEDEKKDWHGFEMIGCEGRIKF